MKKYGNTEVSGSIRRSDAQIIGEKYGKLTAISRHEKSTNGKPYRYFLWRCDCGNKKVINYYIVKRGASASCGCAKVEQNQSRAKKPGKIIQDNPLYATWKGMVGRCLVTSNNAYDRYGGRGIKVCDRWLGDRGLENFCKDMGAKPSEDHSIDRIDNDGDYTPENCRWATRTEQCSNTRRNRFVVIDGKRMTVLGAIRHYNLSGPPSTYYSRLDKGWSVSDTFK